MRPRPASPRAATDEPSRHLNVTPAEISMVDTFLAGAKKRFKKVRAVSRDTLPPVFRRDHIEMYELMR